MGANVTNFPSPATWTSKSTCGVDSTTNDDASKVATERWGFNDSGFTVNTFVGPGYFVVTPDGGEVLVDYTQYPPRPHVGGPRILSNSARLSRFVFNNTKDRVRAVSKHVSIGRAWRGAKRLDNWFVLCRTA